MSGKIVAGYNPLLKVTIFQQHLTHTYTQIETGEGKKKTGAASYCILCLQDLCLVVTSNKYTRLQIKVHINPLILPPLEISLFFARQIGATKTFVHPFCSFPIFSIPCCKFFSLVFLGFVFNYGWVFLSSLMYTHRTLVLVVPSLALCRMCA